MNRILLVCCVILFCHLCVKSCARISVARDFGFLRDFSREPRNELDLFDYICKSRYWTVENQVKMNRIRADFNKYGDLDLLSSCNSSLVVLIFCGEPFSEGFQGVSNNIERQAHLAPNCPQKMLLSNTTTIGIDEREPGILLSYKFKKNIISYLSGIVQDIEAGSIDKRLLLENALRFGFSSFGAEDITIIRGDAILGGNKMRGWINVGKRGPIHAKLFDAESGKRIGEYKAYRTNQYVGFDADPSKKYFFEIPLDVDGSGELVNARIELYSGLDTTLLFATNAVLQTWVR